MSESLAIVAGIIFVTVAAVNVIVMLEASQHGVQIPYGCRQGLCGTRATRVLSGTVRMDTEDGLTAEQKNAGYVLPCVGRAEGAVVVAA
jgi:ferredoxin